MSSRPLPKLRPAAALLALGLAQGICGDVLAQGFQLPSWLGGPRQEAPPPVPPANIPDGAQPVPAPGAPIAPGAPTAPMPPAEPAPPRPVVAKSASEDSVLGRPLRRNGLESSLRLERAGREEWRARISLEGTRISRPGEACTVALADPVPVALRGRPDGLLRLEIAAPSCPMTASVLDGALLMRPPTGLCAIEASDCRVDPRGLWGPEPAALAPLARTIEQDRGQADRAVRENYKVLTGRAAPTEVRAIVSEQAGFSSERETVCRNYRGEANHGFCNARYTEGRAAQLAARLGIAPAISGGSATPAQPRPPRPPAPPPVQLSPSGQE